MSRDELTLDIPEHSDLQRVFPGTDWNTAATTCPGLNSDLCSATQYMRLRNAHDGTSADMFYNDVVGRRAVWSKNFSDNDAGRINFALQSSDDPSIAQTYGFPKIVAALKQYGISAVSYTHLTLPTSDLV